MPSTLSQYAHPLGLLTDLYQLTMACGYWKLGLADREAVFHVSFRAPPFNGGFAIASGLESVVDWMERFSFSAEDLAYLATLEGSDRGPLFDKAFLHYLRTFRPAVDIDAVPEGTVVFGQEPLLRVKGGLLACQLLESVLLNLINFPTLIATKAARVCFAARGEPVLEFGLRRAQGIDGALTASRAAYIGGCAATSNVLAGKLFGIPVKGTHAHSWVMCFEDELESFDAYARAMPNNCVFLVDTYNSLEGVRRAAEIGRRLKAAGHHLLGIRLDSGDLAYLSIEARKILDAAGFPDAAILASNDLDERIIASLKEQGATVNVWGVGTKLVTAWDQPALGGVYKLTALRQSNDPASPWQYKIKLSENIAKTGIPGILQVRRYSVGAGPGRFRADLLFDEIGGVQESILIDPRDPTRRRAVPENSTHEDLLVPIFRAGRRVCDLPPLEMIRTRAGEQLEALHPAIKRSLNPHEYPVGLEESLFHRRQQMILAARGVAPGTSAENTGRA